MSGEGNGSLLRVAQVVDRGELQARATKQLEVLAWFASTLVANRLFTPSPPQFDHWIEALAMALVGSLTKSRPRAQAVLLEAMNATAHFDMDAMLLAANESLWASMPEEDAAAKLAKLDQLVSVGLRQSRAWLRAELRRWIVAQRPLSHFFPPVPELRWEVIDGD